MTTFRRESQGELPGGGGADSDAQVGSLAAHSGERAPSALPAGTRLVALDRSRVGRK